VVLPCITPSQTTFLRGSHGFLVTFCFTVWLNLSSSLFCHYFFLLLFYYISSPSPSIFCYCFCHLYFCKLVKLLWLIFFSLYIGHQTSIYLYDLFICIVLCWSLLCVPLDLQCVLLNSFILREKKKRTEEKSCPHTCHEGIQGGRGVDAPILSLSSRCRWVVNFVLQPCFAWEGTLALLAVEAGWASELVWTYWRWEIFVAFTRIWAVDTPTHSLATVPTTLSWLIVKHTSVIQKLKIKTGVEFQLGRFRLFH